MPIPLLDGGRGRYHLTRPLRLPALVLALAFAAGCTSPREEEATPLAGASIEGSIAVGDAFILEDARISVAPANQAADGTPGREVPLADPPWTARTALLRDHWVLEATLRERAPGAAVGVHRVRLDWNGELAGVVYIEGQNATRPQAVVVRFDVGETIGRSNVYAFELSPTP